MMTRLISVFAGSILLLLLAGPVNAQIQDQIYLHENPTRPTRGVIDEVTATVVKIRVNSVVRDVEVNDISRITFADDPTQLQQVRGMVRRKQYEAAKAELDKLPKVEGPGAGQVHLAAETAKLFEQAEQIAEKSGDSFVTAEKLL
ncbi:MAG: hypothetical protein QGH11_03310, partial [Pirellulaceae bacterium]|nr:hypothetical protein [Pirellulaceae bacterium]